MSIVLLSLSDGLSLPKPLACNEGLLPGGGTVGEEAFVLQSAR